MDTEGLEIRHLTPLDEETIRPWYEAIGDVMPTPEIRGEGFIVSKSGIDLACGFIIQTEASFAIYEFLQTNPRASVYLKSRAVRLLADFMVDHVKKLGFKSLLGFVPSDHKSLLKMYKRMGGKILPKPMNVVVKEL